MTIRHRKRDQDTHLDKRMDYNKGLGTQSPQKHSGRKWREKRAEAQRDTRMTGGSDSMTPQHGAGARLPSSNMNVHAVAKSTRPEQTGQPVDPPHHV